MDPNLCRICLSKTGTISLFDKSGEIKYYCKLMRVVNININEMDGLPKLMCDSCAIELAVAYDFVLKCEASDKVLRGVEGAAATDGRCLQSEMKLELDTINTEDIKHELDLINYDTDHLLDTFSNDRYSDTEDYTKNRLNKKKKGVKQNALKNVCDSVQSDLDQFNDLLETIAIEKGIESDTSLRKRKKRSKKEPIKCVVCGLAAVCQSAMDAHMRTHTGEKPYQCQICNSQFRTKGALKNHNESRHLKRERKFTCETCGNSFYRKNDIIIHMRVHTDEKPYVCSYCSQSFRQIASLIRHRRVHTGEKPFPCPICGKKFADKHIVKKHLTVHSDEKKYSCHLCSKSVKTRSGLRVHLELHSNQKQNICSFCGAAFNRKGNLQTHIRRVHSERSGQCTVCLKTFSDLGEHMRKHTGEKPFVCKICNQRFATKRSLTQHTAFKHENIAKYKCSIGDCTRTFPTSMMLEFHLLKQHKNNTPYVCQHCSRGFFRTCDLSRHLRVSHMDIQIKVPLKTVDVQ